MPWRVVFCRSNPIAPDPRVEKEAQALANAGYSVSLVGWDRSASLPPHEQVGGLNCYRLPIQAVFGTGIRNLPALLRWQWGLLKWLVEHRQDYDSIHACDFDTILPALICKYVWQKKVVYDIFDFYADHLRATPRWIKNIIRRVDRKAINLVDGIILVDDARYQQIQGTRYKRSTVIYNTPQDVYTARQSPKKTDRSHQLCIAYIGLLQVERGIFELLHVLERHPEWHLDLAGFGGDQEKIVQLVADMENVTWHGRINYDQTIHLSEYADVLYAMYDPSIENHRYASPNKLFEAMMLAKPVIVALGTNMDRIVEESACGILINYGTSDEIETALVQLHQNPDLRIQLGQNGRRAYETTYHWDIMQLRLLDIYKQVINSQSAA